MTSALQDAIAAAKNADPLSPSYVLDTLLASLRSGLFRCPGNHRKDGGVGEYEELIYETMLEMGIEDEAVLEDPSSLFSTNRSLYERVIAAADAQWAGSDCDGQIEIWMESDGEYGEHRYPVASGQCADALGLDDDDDYSHPVWQRYFERSALLAVYYKAQDARQDAIWMRPPSQLADAPQGGVCPLDA